MNCPKCGAQAVYRRRVRLETEVDVDYGEINPDHYAIRRATEQAIQKQACKVEPYWPYVVKHQKSLGCVCPSCGTQISPPESDVR